MFFHQAQEIRVKRRIVARPSFSAVVVPDRAQAAVDQNSELTVRPRVLEHEADGPGQPLGLENHGVPEALVVAEEDDVAEVVEK